MPPLPLQYYLLPQITSVDTNFVNSHPSFITTQAHDYNINVSFEKLIDFGSLRNQNYLLGSIHYIVLMIRILFLMFIILRNLILNILVAMTMRCDKHLKLDYRNLNRCSNTTSFIVIWSFICVNGQYWIILCRRANSYA